MKVPLYLIGGFLGSGKTSLLNSILSLYKGLNAGVIINEFGDLGIDSGLIPADSEIKVSELNGGQIFCSCLSGSFINSIAAYKETDIQLLLVEASGLAKPAPLKEIIELAEKTSENFFDYRGMITLVDAQRFEILDKTLMTLGEQISYSDAVLINKTDLSDGETVERIKLRIHELKPGIRIETTTFGKIDAEFLDNLSGTMTENITAGIKKWAGWGEAGRPRSLSLIPESPVEKSRLKKFLKEASSEAFRIKGFLKTGSGETLQVDCTGPDTGLHRIHATAAEKENGIVILLPGNSVFPEKAEQIWQEITGISAGVKF